MKIKFCNLFLFILSFYRVKIVYLFARVTRVVPTYKFGGICFFIWTWLCYRLSHIAKDNSFRKKKTIIHKAKACGESTLTFLTCYCGLLQYFLFCFWFFLQYFAPFFFYFFPKIIFVNFTILILSWLKI